jgi:hypothetical protein
MKQPPSLVTGCYRCYRRRRCELVCWMAHGQPMWLCRMCCAAVEMACNAALAHGYKVRP